MNRPATLLVLLLAGLLAGCGGGSRPTGIRTAETPADDVAEYQPRWRSHTVDSTPVSYTHLTLPTIGAV